MNRYKLLETRSVFKGRLIELKAQKIKLPNGHVVNFETISHPGAVLIIPFLSEDKIILLRQLRPVIGKYIYELPAGTLKKGERPALAAKREIVEETGFSAGKLVKAGVIFPVPGYSTEKITIFKATALKEGKFAPEKDEVIATKIVTKKEVKSLFKKGKIIDAKTISAFAFCGWL
jgi:ADP-ribose pyrophosphatase